MASDTASPESRALRRHSASLVAAIVDPLDLSWKLYAREVIEETTNDRVEFSNQTVTEKNSILVSAIRRRVAARPSLFHSLVDILNDNQDDILRELGEKLETTYEYSIQPSSDTKEQNFIASTTKHMKCSPPLPLKCSSTQLTEHRDSPYSTPPKQRKYSMTGGKEGKEIKIRERGRGGEEGGEERTGRGSSSGRVRQGVEWKGKGEGKKRGRGEEEGEIRGREGGQEKGERFGGVSKGADKREERGNRLKYPLCPTTDSPKIDCSSLPPVKQIKLYSPPPLTQQRESPSPPLTKHSVTSRGGEREGKGGERKRGRKEESAAKIGGGGGGQGRREQGKEGGEGGREGEGRGGRGRGRARREEEKREVGGGRRERREERGEGGEGGRERKGKGEGEERRGREKGMSRKGEQEYSFPLIKQNSLTVYPPLATHPSLLTPPPQSPVCRYADYLRAFYQTSELPAYNKWPPTPSTTFINLALICRKEVSRKDLEDFALATLHGGVDQILQVKEPIQLEEILTPIDGKTLNCVLMEGAPGVGKTTLAWEISKRWGKGELFQQFAIVMLLRLRDQRVQNANSITDLVFYRDQDCQEDEACCKDISRHLIQISGRDLLLILEGLDELPAHLITQTSVFSRLLSGTLLPQATILVTSRPSATAHIWKNWEQRVSQHIEVIGFTDENISQYIASVLPPQQLPDFQYYLSMNTHLKTTMYIPLHAAIVIEVYRWCQHPRRPLPKTITQLYTCLVNIILQRYLSSHPDYKGNKIQLQKISDLPSPVYAHFKTLLQMAYTGVMQQRLVFYDQCQPINHLGFMDAVTELFPSFSNKQVTYSYNFLHLSIQEYLAAYYVSTMEIHEQEQLLGTMCALRHLQNIARFLAGITRFKDMDRTIVKEMIGVEREEVVTKLSTNALQLLYECRDAKILDSSQFYVYPLYDHNPKFDFDALGYIITHSNCKWRLQLGGPAQYMDAIEKIQLLVQALNDHTDPSYLYSIESIEFYCGEQPQNVMTGMPQSILSQVQALWLVRRHNQTLPQFVPKLIPSMNSLHTLMFSNAKGDTEMHSTMQAVVSTNTLKELRFDYCEINSESVTTLCQWLSTITQLEILRIEDSLTNAIERILLALATNSTLKLLHVLGLKLNISAGQALYSMLTCNKAITDVSLQLCDIGDDIVHCLAEALHSNSTLTTLIIHNNSISDRGAESIVQALQSNSTLTSLYIGANSISDRGTKSIAQALHSNSMLTTLDISSNSIGDRGAESIAQALHSNSTLTTLDISSNSIGDRGAESIAQALHSNNTLTSLDISGNSIGDRGAESIAQALHSNNTLTSLDISGNSINDSGAICIVKMLKANNYTLQEVNLSRNKIGNEGQMALQEVRKTNKHVKLEYRPRYNKI